MKFAKVEHRIQETITWCRHFHYRADPETCLRTPALRPSNFRIEPNGSLDYVWQPVEQTQAVIEDLAARRADLLREKQFAPERYPPNTSAGRLLVCCPEESDWSGMSEAASKGFIDVVDVPAWDTWICYREEPNTPEERFRRRMQPAGAHWENEPKTPASVSYLLCWTPRAFVPAVEEGIQVNPMGCGIWTQRDCCTERRQAPKPARQTRPNKCGKGLPARAIETARRGENRAGNFQ